MIESWRVYLRLPSGDTPPQLHDLPIMLQGLWQQLQDSWFMGFVCVGFSGRPKPETGFLSLLKIETLQNGLSGGLQCRNA